MRNKFYIGALVLFFTGLVIEIVQRKFHPPYLEDEGRSISIIGVMVPIIILSNIVLTDTVGFAFMYEYNPGILIPIKYFQSLHIEKILYLFINYSTMLIFFVLLAVSITCSISKRRIQVYKTFPVDRLKQYFTRIMEVLSQPVHLPEDGSAHFL